MTTFRGATRRACSLIALGWPRRWHNSSLAGIVLMLVATGLFSTTHTMVRSVSGDLHPFEVAFFRNLFSLLTVLVLLLRTGPSALRTAHPRLQGLRGVVGVVAMLTWFMALALVPIAQATALSFTSAIFASIGAVVFLGERMGARRWSAVVVGFVGALIILRPGFTEPSLGALLVVLSALAWGGSVVLSKHISRRDSTVSVVFYGTAVLTVLSAPAALWYWQTPTWEQFLWLGAIGMVGSMATLCLTHALKLADATAVLPLDFTRLIWAGLLGYLAFGEVPDLWTVLGGTVIFSSTLYIACRESRLRRAASAP